MKRIFLLVCLVVFCLGCSTSDSDSDSISEGESGLFSADGDGSGASDPGSGNGNENTQAGQITAGEWNDLNNWDFWNDLLFEQEESLQQNLWQFNAVKRISIQVVNALNVPVNNAKVSLYKGDDLIFESRTDNFGETNVFIDLFQSETTTTVISEYTISVNDVTQPAPILLMEDGINTYTTNDITIENRMELAFIVDATGSMADELEFLKNDLTDVINKVQVDNPNTAIYTGTVFYRDEGDEYVTKLSGFSKSVEETTRFIKAQSAGGGGDYPEAVHTALDETLTGLQWGVNSKTKIAFLLLDAPPHESEAVNTSLKSSIIKAAKQGVKIIPIVASGIDKPTEFLMRHFAIATNGTYVFITNDSGIGNNHLEPTVGDYQVEFLNDLMVRLINKYAK